MAFAQAQTRQHGISEINITPLVDVMLVMLVIFMIAAPVFSRPIALDLPRGIDDQHPLAPPPLELRIDATGQVFLGGQPVPKSALGSIFSAELVRAGTAPVVLQIDVDDEADYQSVVDVMAAAKNAGLNKLRFYR